jgi:hypothetical protein
MPILFGCTNLNIDKKNNSSSSVESTIQQNQVNVYPIELNLDTTSQLQNQLIEPEDSLFFGNQKYLIHVSQGNEIGYVLYKTKNNFYVSLIEWNNCFKVVGISEIAGLNEGEEYIELLYSDSPINSITFGIIRKTDFNIKTVKAWQINNSKRLVEEINPATVDFTETYNTDTD